MVELVDRRACNPEGNMASTTASNIFLGFNHNDGGARAAGYKAKNASDCVVRSIAIASGLDYKVVQNELMDRGRVFAAKYADQKRNGKPTRKAKIAQHYVKKNFNMRAGVHKELYEPLLSDLGFIWTPQMQIGTGTTLHVAAGELPVAGTYILKLSRHLTVLIDNVIHDTFQCDRDGSRAVYGWYQKPQQEN